MCNYFVYENQIQNTNSFTYMYIIFYICKITKTPI